VKPETAFAGGRTRRFRRGAIATLTSQVVRALGQVVLVPVFLGAWGARLYGEWLTLAALAAQMGLLDLGVQTYVLNRLNQDRARGELEAYTRTLHSALHWCLVLAVVAVALVAGAAFSLPVESWFRLEIVGHGTAAMVATLLAVQVASQVPYGLVTGLYRTVGEFATGMTVYNAQRVLLIVLTAGAVAAGGSLVHVALAQLVPTAACLAFVLADLRRRHPEIRIGTSKREARLARSFLGPSSLFFLIRTSQAASLQGSTLIAGAMFGPAAVTLLVTLRTLCNLVRQLAGALGNALWPELTALEARGGHETLRRVHSLAVKVITAVSIAAAVALHHAGASVVELWTRGDLAYSAPLMDALLLLLVLQAPWTTSSIFLVATNRHGPVAFAYGAAGVLGLLLGWALAGEHGLPGLVLGLLAAELVVSAWWIPRATCALVGERFTRYLGTVLLPALPIAGAAWFLAGAAARLTSDAAHGADALAAVATVAVAVPVLTWLAWLDEDERGRVRALFSRVTTPG
jgi:O-antigen/teichoic acid export membrane protein